MNKRRAAAGGDRDALLWPFIDFAKEEGDQLAKYLIHCGIDAEDINDAGDVEKAILAHYRLASGGYDIAAAACDLDRWPPIAARVRELKRLARRRGISSSILPK